MKEEPLVSIIVPVYNRELSITYCLDSILGLSYSNFELIIIDDGSTDDTNRICQKYQQMDNRIRLITKNNEGVSVARNLGLSLARAEWITFVDSDDVILPFHLDVIRRYNTPDLIFTKQADASFVNGALAWKEKKDNDSDLLISGQREIIDYLFGDYNPYLNPIYSCCDKFFRADIIKNNRLQFPIDVSFGEDQIFVLTYLNYINTCLFQKRITYLCVSYEFPIVHLNSQIRPYQEMTYCILENFYAFQRLLFRQESKALTAYTYNYLYDRLISRILYKYRDSPCREIFNNKSLAQYIDLELRPILKTNISKIKYVRKIKVIMFTYLIIYGSARSAIILCDCLLSLYKMINIKKYFKQKLAR